MDEHLIKDPPNYPDKLNVSAAWEAGWGEAVPSNSRRDLTAIRSAEVAGRSLKDPWRHAPVRNAPLKGGTFKGIAGVAPGHSLFNLDSHVKGN